MDRLRRWRHKQQLATSDCGTGEQRTVPLRRIARANGRRLDAPADCRRGHYCDATPLRAGGRAAKAAPPVGRRRTRFTARARARAHARTLSVVRQVLLALITEAVSGARKRKRTARRVSASRPWQSISFSAPVGSLHLSPFWHPSIACRREF